MIKPVAIYLPQFHPTPENDEWWGKGFTEWTNVSKARPLFKGHYQPHLPTDFGHYDLRCIETIEDQAKLAMESGLYGFCFYHYWFSGKRLLHRPIDLMLHSQKPDFPFMLFWANETWSRRWLGEEKEVLIKQEYSPEDDYNHITWLCENAFCDDRYIQVDGKPVFVIYRPLDLPDYQHTISIFRKVAKSKGYKDVYLIASNSHFGNHGPLLGFDSFLNFEPQLSLLPEAFNENWSFKRLLRNLKFNIWNGKLKVYDYAEVKQIMMNRKFPYKFHPCAFVGWDNTPRRDNRGIIMVNQNIRSFSESIQWAKQISGSFPDEEQFLFVNAWNEWAEGNHLEPDILYKKNYLLAFKKIVVDGVETYSNLPAPISSYS